MRSPRAGRFASIVVASAVLAGGVAAGSGVAAAAPAGSLLPAESVAAPTGSSDGVKVALFEAIVVAALFPYYVANGSEMPVGCPHVICYGQ
ncbi:hypothetical protein SAMN05444580_11545 [Rhodococcus tukisamuensis]|uniref:Uncharacterized protein n=2 Tax=Rhodococcus tukisamuensis TaxID=168276 RepID=A0A1G7C760_9NOCA|nr:hypothetical protein SAMN05444580_11545 [Rhodococcus tukisamuensis]